MLLLFNELIIRFFGRPKPKLNLVNPPPFLESCTSTELIERDKKGNFPKVNLVFVSEISSVLTDTLPPPRFFRGSESFKTEVVVECSSLYGGHLIG